jgi:hypothetical protein
METRWNKHFSLESPSSFTLICHCSLVTSPPPLPRCSSTQLTNPTVIWPWYRHPFLPQSSLLWIQLKCPSWGCPMFQDTSLPQASSLPCSLSPPRSRGFWTECLPRQLCHPSLRQNRGMTRGCAGNAGSQVGFIQRPHSVHNKPDKWPHSSLCAHGYPVGWLLFLVSLNMFGKWCHVSDLASLPFSTSKEGNMNSPECCKSHHKIA